jgi:hypothetical protein
VLFAEQVAEQRDLGTVMQHFLIHPPDGLDEPVLGVAAVGGLAALIAARTA